jgi:hypothetical protein
MSGERAGLVEEQFRLRPGDAVVFRDDVEDMRVGLANVGSLSRVVEMHRAVGSLEEDGVLIGLALVAIDESGGSPLRGAFWEARYDDAYIGFTLPGSGEPDAENVAVFKLEQVGGVSAGIQGWQVGVGGTSQSARTFAPVCMSHDSGINKRLENGSRLT